MDGYIVCILCMRVAKRNKYISGERKNTRDDTHTHTHTEAKALAKEALSLYFDSIYSLPGTVLFASWHSKGLTGG